MKKRPAATLLGMSFLLLIVSLWAAGIRPSDRPPFRKTRPGEFVVVEPDHSRMLVVDREDGGLASLSLIGSTFPELTNEWEEFIPGSHIIIQYEGMLESYPGEISGATSIELLGMAAPDGCAEAKAILRAYKTYGNFYRPA